MNRIRFLGTLARAAAMVGLLLMLSVALLSVASIVGRNVQGWTLAGDFELTAAATGAALALFMPWCQWTQGHLVVDFFTRGASARAQARLAQLGAACVAAVMGLLAWRSALGAWSAWRSQAGSMILGFPEWLVYAVLVPALALSALIAALQALGMRAEAAPQPLPEPAQAAGPVSMASPASPP